MEKGHPQQPQQQQNGATNRQRAPPKKAAGCPDDCGQLDNIIGGFGKYQLMIFMFKILIGATSAFNNLGVTFFAPTDFVSFWCADGPPAQFAGPLANHSTVLSYGGLNEGRAHDYNHGHGHDLGHDLGHNHGHADPFLGRLVAPADDYQLINQTGPPLESGHHVRLPPAAPSFIKQNIRQLLGDFVSSEARGQKRQQLAYSSDTPRNLRKECDYLSPADNRRHKCTAFRYDTGIWLATIIDEWDLVCDRALFVSVTQSLYMAGFIVSYLLFGYMSDRFGRWNSLLLGALIEILSGFGCAFAGSIRSFMVFRFLLGLGNAGRSSSSYLIMIEWTGQSWRMHISTLGSLGWAAGYCLMPWLTLYFLHFRHMQLFVCFYELVFIVWLLALPESPRWLLTHHRFTEAYAVLLNAAKFNGLIVEDSGQLLTGPDKTNDQNNNNNNNNQAAAVVVRNAIDQREQQQQQRKAQERRHPDEASSTSSSCTGSDSSEHRSLRPYTLEEFQLKFARLCESISQKEFTKNEDRLSFIDLFRWPNLRRYLLILAFAWAADSFIYYGIALRVGDFGAKNLFVSFTMAGLTELPSIAFTMLCMKFLPRRTTNIFLFSVIFLLCALQVPLKYYELAWLQQATAMLAKLFNSCAFTCILYQTMELFPTSIRQTAYSSCSLAGRVGSILAPFVKELSQLTDAVVPPIIYAILSLLEIALVKELPETQGSDLPDTLLEAERFGGTDNRAAGGQANGGLPDTADDHKLRRRKLPV